MTEPARAHCYRCDKPAFMCLCDRITPVEHETAITILQHPRERSHPFGTARIARLGLRRCEVRVAHGEEVSSLERRRVHLPLSFEPGTAVLYPRRDAPTLESLPLERRPARLVVLDGTWSQAKRLWDDNPELAALPCVRLAPAAPSRYRIRREPSFEAISTLEAIVLALSILEPERAEALETLLASFDAMIDDQLGQRSSRRSLPRHKAKRRGPAPPAALFAPLERLVLIDAEHRGGNREKVMARLSALRLDGSALLDVLIGPRPPAWHLAHIGLPAARFDGAAGEAEALARLAALLRPDDVVLAWHPQPLRLASSAIGERAAIELKAVYCNLQGGRCGSLEALVARLGLSPAAPRVEGRIGPWLASAESIAGWLRRSRPIAVEPRDTIGPTNGGGAE